MLNIILTGHSRFASGMINSLLLITSDICNVYYDIDFLEVDSPDDLENKYLKIINNNDGDFIFLTDLLGGTSFKTSSILSTKCNDKKIYAISGTN